MPLALFDLDNTLLNGDSDHAWGIHLCEIGAVDVKEHSARQHQYYEDYTNGVLDIDEFLEFQLKPLAENSMGALKQWRQDYVAKKIEPMIEKKALTLIDQHRTQGHDLAIITSTNTFVTKPIAERLGIGILIGTDPEVINDQFTGKVAGPPCFQHGKVIKLHDWMTHNQQSLDGSWFYSDSHNDLPLMLEVDNPVATNPDEKLTIEANQRDWPIVNLFET
ncbi:MAG: HAD family hydrolase [Proteobacteria bacterium]|jgi:HAD superfamily hydrolase (TIGR01490 family)|nr:HAD family hydrolase [Pseudomonadota bacterium]